MCGLHGFNLRVHIVESNTSVVWDKFDTTSTQELGSLFWNELYLFIRCTSQISPCLRCSTVSCIFCHLHMPSQPPQKCIWQSFYSHKLLLLLLYIYTACMEYPRMLFLLRMWTLDIADIISKGGESNVMHVRLQLGWTRSLAVCHCQLATPAGFLCWFVLDHLSACKPHSWPLPQLDPVVEELH